MRTRQGTPFPIVNSVVEPSGHSTYRIISGVEVFTRRWPILSRCGCTYERADDRLVAIDVPAHIVSVYRALEDGERAGEWDFEEGHCGRRV